MGCQQVVTTQQLCKYVSSWMTGGDVVVSCSTTMSLPLQANGVDAFEELKKMAIDGKGGRGGERAAGQAAPARACSALILRLKATPALPFASPHALLCLQPRPAVVKRKPAITNTQLTKASHNGNGNGRAVAPEEAKVGCGATCMSTLCIFDGAGRPRCWPATAIMAWTTPNMVGVVHGNSLSSSLTIPQLNSISCPIPAAAPVCQAAA